MGFKENKLSLVFVPSELLFIYAGSSAYDSVVMEGLEIRIAEFVIFLTLFTFIDRIL